MHHTTGFFQRSVEERNNRKRKDQELFKKRAARKMPQGQMPPQEKITEADLQQEKQLRRRAQKELKLAQEQLLQMKQQISEQKQLIKQQEAAIKQLQHEQWEIRQEQVNYQLLEKEVEEQNQRLELERSKRIKVEWKMERLTKKRSNKQSNNKVVELSNQVKQLKKANTFLRHQVENDELLAKQKYGNLQEEVGKMQQELRIYRHRENELYKDPMFLMDHMKRYVSSDHIPDLLEIMEGFITTKNLNYFYRDTHNLFYLYMRRVNLLTYQAQRRVTPYHLQNKMNSTEITRLGYITYQNNTWLFVDVSDSNQSHSYPIKGNKTGKELVKDCPAKGIVDSEGVTIHKLFPIESQAISQLRKRIEISNKERRNYLHYGNFKVLVIGSRYMNEYKKRLEMHGCSVFLHNPYEESYEILAGKISRAEIILVCERHIPHAMWDYVDRSQPYVSVLKQDSKDLISSYAYLTLQRCELV